jgi:hypothetical protein
MHLNAADILRNRALKYQINSSNPIPKKVDEQAP